MTIYRWPRVLLVKCISQTHTQMQVMRAEKDPCADCRDFSTSTETDWLAILLALAAAVYSGAHYIGYDFEYLQHYLHFARSPHVRAIAAVLQSLAINLIRFILAFLGITLLLVLECKKALYYLVRRFSRSGFVSTLAGGASVTEMIGVHFDAANHSHHANATRQRLRVGRARLGALLRWGISVAFAVVLFHGPPDFTDSPPAIEHEIRRYVVPAWVVLARPENRYHDRSNSHYVHSEEHLVFDKRYNSRIRSLELQSAGSQNSELVISNTKGIMTEERDPESFEAGNESPSTVVVAHTQTARHTRTVTETETTTVEVSVTDTPL